MTTHETAAGIIDAGFGGTLVTLSVWSWWLDVAITSTHVATVIGGLIIAVLGAKRAIRHELANRRQRVIAAAHMAKKAKR